MIPFCLWCWLAIFAGSDLLRAGEDASLGPLFDRFPLALSDGIRTEVGGPFFYSFQTEAQNTWAIPPLFSSYTDSGTDSRELDFAYPVLTYDRFGSEYRFQIIQLFSFSGGQQQTGAAKDRFTLFPFFFNQRSPDTTENYTALFPIYGHLNNRLFRAEMDFALWPLYVKTKRRPGAGTVGADEFLKLGNRYLQSRRGDITTYNFIAPIFHLRYGEGLRGWQVWPLAGHEHKVVTTRTNVWGEADTIPGFEKTFVAWPIWLHETRDLGTTNASEFRSLIPFYSALRSPERDSTTYLWPFGLTKTDDRAKKYHETDFFWSGFVYARGEGKTSTRFWPLFGLAHNDSLENNFYLWPIYKYSHQRAAVLDRERTRFLLLVGSDTRVKNTATGKESRRTDLWPLFSHTRDFEGNTRFQMLALLDPLLSPSKSIERNYSPFWALWRAERNATTGASSQSLLWNLYRHQVTAEGKRTSFLFGLFQHRSTTAGSSLRLFFIPVQKAPAPKPMATVASTPQIAQPASEVNR